jgi:hypothetical protein
MRSRYRSVQSQAHEKYIPATRTVVSMFSPLSLTDRSLGPREAQAGRAVRGYRTVAQPPCPGNQATWIR